MRPGWKASPSGHISSKPFYSVCSRDSKSTSSVPRSAVISSVSKPGQDKDNPRKRLYKVFDRVEDVRRHETAYGSTLSGTARVQQNKAVRQALSNSLSGKMANQPTDMDDLFGAPVKHPAPKATNKKKGKKELTPDQQEKKDLEKELQRILS